MAAMRNWIRYLEKNIRASLGTYWIFTAKPGFSVFQSQ